MNKELRLEVLLSKLMNIDFYFREMKKLNLANMKEVQTGRHKVISIDTDSDHTNEEESKTAEVDCEHQECH